MSTDGANTWNSITNDLASAQAGQNSLPQLQMWNLLPQVQPGSGLGGVINVNISYLDPVTKIRLSNSYSSTVPSNPTSSYSWGMSMYGPGGVLPASSAAINPNTGVLYSAYKSTAGNPSIGQVGYLEFYAQSFTPPYNNFAWTSESITYSNSNPNAGYNSVASVSVDNQMHVYFTLSDGTSYYGQAPR